MSTSRRTVQGPLLRFLRIGVLLAAAGIAPAAAASGLQVEPVSVDIAGRSSAIWLSNTSDAPLQAQIRVYRWNQDTQSEILVPTDAVLASPAMATIAADGRQLVRLIAASPLSCEDSYRLAIDEVPSIAIKGSGIRYVLHYSLPVFVTARGCAKIHPDLIWRMEPSAKGMALVVANRGTMHAQLADIHVIAQDGRRIDLAPGLLGYVLPEKERRFTFPVAVATMAGARTIELAVNGSPVTRPLAPDSAGR